MPPLLSTSDQLLSSFRHPLALRSLLPSIHDIAPRSENHLLPTRTIQPLQSIPRSLASLFRRQVITVTATASPTTTTNTVTATPLIPANYAGINDGPAPGTVVGIVFGSVGGFLLLLWLIYTCFQFGRGNATSAVVREEYVRRQSRTESRRRSSPRRPPSPPSSQSVTEIMEVRSEHRSEHREREREMSPPPPPRRESRRERETIVEQTFIRPVREPEEDEVVVIEEHSPAPREKTKKLSGYRTVDPESFGGGDRPVRNVSRR